MVTTVYMGKAEILEHIEAELLKDLGIIGVDLAPDLFELLGRPDGFAMNSGREVRAQPNECMSPMHAQFRTR